MGKIRLATVWLSGCSGCHMSLLDIDEALIELAERFELCKSPLTDIKEFPEDGVDITLIEGAVANDEHVEIARTARSSSKIVVALGDCAVTGNVPALRNGIPPERLIEEIYGPDLTTDGTLPRTVVPRLLERVRPLNEVIDVDYSIHGCPPPPGLIAKALIALLDGREPELTGEDLKFG